MTIAISDELDGIAGELEAEHLAATLVRWAEAVRTGRPDHARLIVEEIEASCAFFPRDVAPYSSLGS